jgi:hypothetical protein
LEQAADVRQLRKLIGGQSYADDYTVIWRDLSIGRIMKASASWRMPRSGQGPAIFSTSRGWQWPRTDLDDSEAKPPDQPIQSQPQAAFLIA